MKKMILLCLVFVFSNAIYAQDSKTKVKKEKATIEKVVKEKRDGAALRPRHRHAGARSYKKKMPRTTVHAPEAPVFVPFY